jgi:hypothetical protein
MEKSIIATMQIFMIKLASRKKNNRLQTALILPFLPIVLIAGWSLYQIGKSWNPNTNQLPNQIHKKPAKQEEVELIIIPQKELVIN